MDPHEKMLAPSRSLGIDIKDILVRIIKYMVEGGAVAIAAYLIPRKQMTMQEIIMIALTAAAVFAILDMFAPAVGLATRQGAGFGLGFGLIQSPGITLPGGTIVPGVPPPPVM
jgi:hypothetical protein